MYAEKAFKEARTTRIESYHGDLARDDPAYKAAEKAHNEAYAIYRAAKNAADSVRNQRYSPKGGASLEAVKAYKAAEAKAKEVLGAAKGKANQALKIARAKAKPQHEQAQKAERIASNRFTEAKAKAERAQHTLEAHAREVRQAKSRAERAFQDVYMAAALGAFKHVAEAAIEEADKHPFNEH